MTEFSPEAIAAYPDAPKVFTWNALVSVAVRRALGCLLRMEKSNDNY